VNLKRDTEGKKDGEGEISKYGNGFNEIGESRK
jgi:hypothetical protein